MTRTNRFDKRKPQGSPQAVDPPALRYEIYRGAPTTVGSQRYGRTTVLDFKTALRTAQAIASALNTGVDVDEVTPLSTLPYANFHSGGRMQWCASPEDAIQAGFIQTQEGWVLNADQSSDQTDSLPES